MNNDRRILELALQGLEAERRRVEEEMIIIRKQLGVRGRRTVGAVAGSGTAQKRQMSAAGRKAISDAMKRRWANFKKKASKN